MACVCAIRMKPTPSRFLVAGEEKRARIDDVLLWRWERGPQVLLVYIRPRGDRSLDALIETAQRVSRLETVGFDSAQAFARWATTKVAELNADGWSRVNG